MLKGLYERHQGRLVEATTLFRQAADLATGTVMPHLLLGRTFEESGSTLDALAVYSEAMQIDPENPDAQTLYTSLRESMVVTAEEE